MTEKREKKHYDYDLVIVGAGISGLYTLYKLSKLYKTLKIILLEANERYGGRIYTYKEIIDEKEYIMDLGAGRLGYDHKLIVGLIKELGLSNKIINIENTKTKYSKKGLKELKGLKGGLASFTLQEVKKHNTITDAWIIIKGKVYDVTSWIPKHPGGKIILQGIGKDATSLFENYGHPKYVEKTILPKYYIGKLVDL